MSFLTQLHVFLGAPLSTTPVTFILVHFFTQSFSSSTQHAQTISALLSGSCSRHNSMPKRFKSSSLRILSFKAVVPNPWPVGQKWPAKPQNVARGTRQIKKMKELNHRVFLTFNLFYLISIFDKHYATYSCTPVEKKRVLILAQLNFVLVTVQHVLLNVSCYKKLWGLGI